MVLPPPISPTSLPRTAGLAIASLVLGILSITCCSILAGIPALILGSIALKRIGASGGTLGGKSQALAGIVMSMVSFALLPFVTAVIAIAASVAVPALSAAQAKAQEAVCLNNVRQCTLACVRYAHDHDTAVPKSWGSVKNYVVNETPGKSLLHCRKDPNRSVSYEIVNPGQRLADLGPPEETIIVREIHANHRGKRAVGYADGHVELRADAR
jgi:prepilin-type processing-associated H-X9-DG protein